MGKSVVVCRSKKSQRSVPIVLKKPEDIRGKGPSSELGGKKDHKLEYRTLDFKLFRERIIVCIKEWLSALRVVYRNSLESQEPVI